MHDHSYREAGLVLQDFVILSSTGCCVYMYYSFAEASSIL